MKWFPSLAALTALCLAACGQMGPLRLPDEQPAPSTAPAAVKDDAPAKPAPNPVPQEPATSPPAPKP